MLNHTYFLIRLQTLSYRGYFVKPLYITVKIINIHLMFSYGKHHDNMTGENKVTSKNQRLFLNFLLMYQENWRESDYYVNYIALHVSMTFNKNFYSRIFAMPQPRWHSGPDKYIRKCTYENQGDTVHALSCALVFLLMCFRNTFEHHVMPS